MNRIALMLFGDLSQAPDVPADELGAPHEVLTRQAERDEVRRAVAALSLKYRTVVVLRYFQGLSYRQIADVLRLPMGTVESRLYAARQARLRHFEAEARNETAPDEM